MKHKQFKLWLTVLMSMVACVTSNLFAQTWTEPVVPTQGSEPVSGQLYRVKNVEADMCIGNGQVFFSWNSTACLVEDNPITWTMEYDEAKNGWTFKGYDGEWPGQYLFITNLGIEGFSMHVDPKTDPHRYYEIVKQESGHYRIRCVASDDTYGENIDNWANRFWGWNRDTGSSYPNGMYAAVNPDDGYACEWEFINMSLYFVQKEMFDLTAEIEEQGYDISYDQYEEAYYSGDYDQTKAACDELKALVNNARIYAVLAVGEDGINPPSDNNPCDATSLIKNASFDAGNIEGWTCTFKSGTNANNGGYQSATFTNGDVKIEKFIEAWSNSAYNPNYSWRALGDGELSQTIYGLPEGLYRVTCDAIAVNQWENDGNPVKGVEFFATNGELELAQSIATGNGQPEHFEIICAITGGDVTIGLRTNNTTANWIAADNFTLTYYGKNIVFADANVKAICVENWDTDGDGELSVAEAAAVTDLGDVFKNNKAITSFDELRYFTRLESIGDAAFYNCSSLTSTIVPNSVITLGYNAFNGCSSLTTIRIPEGVTTIGGQAFCGCGKLTAINLPSTVNSIGYQTFFNCDSLTSIVIPKSVTSIGQRALVYCRSLESIVVEEGNEIYDSRNECNAIIETASNTLIAACMNTIIPEGVTSFDDAGPFDFCSGLTSIFIPQSLIRMGNIPFMGCGGLTSIIVDEENPVYDSRNECNAIIETATNTMITGCMNTIIPDGVTKIGTRAFEESYGLTSITIPNSVTKINNCAFISCTNLKSVNMSNNVASIEGYTFAYCYNLASIDIPQSVTSIGYFAFTYCQALKSVIIPESVTSIGDNAFEGSGLASVVIPNSVTSIGKKAFSGCWRLSIVKVGMKTPIAITEDVFTNRANATLYVPRGSKAAYEAADVWKDFKNILECDYVEVENQCVAEGQSAIMEIGLNNFDTNLVGFQMDLTLPDGVGIDKAGCSLSSRITDEEQELTIGKLEDGTYRLTSSSYSLKPISGTSGTLLTLKLTATEGCMDGQATLSNIFFSTSNSERVTFSDEKFDIHILHKYTLAYKVDGEVYKTEEIVETTPLTPEAEPVKDGYTFGGWSELPETMPASDVVVTGSFYLYGDVNTDDVVDIVDVVDIARFVVATPSEKFREKLADLNYDKTVNIGDAVTLVNHIAGDQNFVRAENSIRKTYDYEACSLELLSDDKNTLSFRLNGESNFTAYQFTMEMPEDMSISDLQLNNMRQNDHQLLYSRMEDGSYRIAVFSLSNSIFSGSEGELLSFVLNGKSFDDVTVCNIHFFDTEANDYSFDDIRISNTDDIVEIVNSKSSNCKSVYDLQGRRLSEKQRGVNIVNGKKIIVR